MARLRRHRGPVLDGDPVCDSGHDSGPDPLGALQVVQSVVGLRSPSLDDRLRPGGPDAWNPGEIVATRGIEIQRPTEKQTRCRDEGFFPVPHVALRATHKRG